MMEILVLLLVFTAVAVVVGVTVPLLSEFGLWRAEMTGAAAGLASSNILYRMVDARKLIQSCWQSALLTGGIFGAIFLASGLFPPVVLLVASLVVGVIGYQLPRFWVRRRFKNRLQLFEARLMDLTLGLANGLRSGASLPQTLELVARDIGGPVGEEFTIVLQEYHLGVELTETLARLGGRMPSEDLNLLMSAVRLTMQAGGSLAEVLDKITDTIRQRNEFHQKVKTMTAQGRFEAIAMASAPLAAFLILFGIDPDLMRPLVQTRIGWYAIGTVVILESIGFFFINKIVTIEV